MDRRQLRTLQQEKIAPKNKVACAIHKMILFLVIVPIHMRSPAEVPTYDVRFLAKPQLPSHWNISTAVMEGPEHI